MTVLVQVFVNKYQGGVTIREKTEFEFEDPEVAEQFVALAEQAFDIERINRWQSIL